MEGLGQGALFFLCDIHFDTNYINYFGGSLVGACTYFPFFFVAE